MRRAPRDPVLAEYAKIAHRYDVRWSRYVGSSVASTLAWMTVAPHDRLLDVGCGTGQLLAALATAPVPLCLFGVDASPEMLAIAQSRLPAGAVLARARAEALPFSSGEFDWVVSTSVFHYLRRPREALAEFRRVLKPGARLVITDWCDDYLACKACGLLLRMFSGAHFRVYTRNECGELLRESLFDEVVIDRYRINWLWGLMTARARRCVTG